MNRSRKRAAGRWIAISALAATLIAVSWIWLRHPAREIEAHHYGDRDSDTSLPHPDRHPKSLQGGRRPDDLRFPAPEHPWIALIIDDFGPTGSARLAPEFLELPFEVTLSVIPGNPKSASVCRLTRDAKRELFIHLPMEPATPTAMGERDMLMVGMNPERLQSCLDRIKSELPTAVGVNNHMGSKATADTALMQILAIELQQRGLLFVDSRTGYNSVAYAIMRAKGVPSLWRDVFLDNERDTVQIAQRLAELASVARQRGWALGIGHVHRETLEILQREVPGLIKSGIRIVSAGKLVRAVEAMEAEIAAGAP